MSPKSSTVCSFGFLLQRNMCMCCGTNAGIANFGRTGGSNRLQFSRSWPIFFGQPPCAVARGLNFPSNCMVEEMERNASATVWARTWCFRFETPPHLTCRPQATKISSRYGSEHSSRVFDNVGRQILSHLVQALKNCIISLRVDATTPFAASSEEVRNKSCM